MPVSVVEDNSAEAQGYFLEKYNRNYSSEATSAGIGTSGS